MRTALLKRLATISTLLLIISACAFTILEHQAIRDWLKLRDYNAPTAVAQLSIDDTMTVKARHLFYVNHPNITGGSVFTSNCPSGGEKTVVLGCYIGNDNGIYLYDVTDTRLAGVEQVTAAHEMLHAAYQRLSTGERTEVDAMLNDYYEHDLTDQRIKDTIAAYKVSEPNDVVNEMHSIFGTEVTTLPSDLEGYYSQYFTNRSKVTAYTNQYQSEFTSRKNQITNYDTQLKSLKIQITDNQSKLDSQRSAIDSMSAKLTEERASGDIETYNAGINGYNQSINTYNTLVNTTRNLISQYNGIVGARNSLVLEEESLVKAITAQPQTTQ